MHQFAARIATPTAAWLLDNGKSPGHMAANLAEWVVETDAASGGISRALLRRTNYRGEPCLGLSGEVSLKAGGGFVRMALDLAPGFDCLDASGFKGLRVSVAGNAQPYTIELQTADTVYSWQCYRAALVALTGWRTLDVPFTAFEPFRVLRPLAVTNLRRLRFAFVGRPAAVELYVSGVHFYADSG